MCFCCKLSFPAAALICSLGRASQSYLQIGKYFSLQKTPTVFTDCETWRWFFRGCLQVGSSQAMRSLRSSLRSVRVCISTGSGAANKASCENPPHSSDTFNFPLLDMSLFRAAPADRSCCSVSDQEEEVRGQSVGKWKWLEFFLPEDTQIKLIHVLMRYCGV